MGISHRYVYITNNMHKLGVSNQVRALMRSIAELKKKLVLANAQGKDHRRSAMIRAMRTRLREQVRAA